MQGWDTNRADRKRLEKSKRLARIIDPPFSKRRSREPGKMISLAVMSALAMKATGSKHTKNTNFDTNYGTPILVKNRCSGCISNVMNDFIRPLVECNHAIRGLGGTRTGGVMIRTIKWEWMDNPGKRIIPKSYYAPQGGAQLIIPQH